MGWAEAGNPPSQSYGEILDFAPPAVGKIGTEFGL
jgi:hypothetical protein